MTSADNTAALRALFAAISDEPLTDEECSNIIDHGYSKPKEDA